MTWPAKADRAWLEALPGVVRDHPLARHMSFNIGGPADYFVETADPAPVVAGCAERGIPHLLLGAGTNLLVADAGVEGLVVRCVGRGWRVEGDRVHAEAGLKMMRLARICSDHDLAGFEWAIGVPGSVGGAVYQNAGCWGSELAEVLESACAWTPDRGPACRPTAELGLGYRTSALRDGPLRDAAVLSATIRLRRGDGAASRAQMAAWTAERTRTQPVRAKNCGSVFRNPPGDSAGRLIEAAGLKGARVGAAEISPRHANFIVNHGGATAADVQRLMGTARSAVSDRFAVAMEPEVELVGRWGG
ncbi:MAG: UDP-N-acetylmuramate dehydrogenase [Candidatus Dormibacteraeota bacterium]|nr:UDP-N-acetylmuramate dehydrogenase [Candidatus Dormibacteraeota bacterium]